MTTYRAAKRAIEAILASIPDSHLPEFDKVETGSNGQVIVWHGGSGWVLGSAMRNHMRDPSTYREHAVADAIVREAVYRADKRLFDNGDDPTGINFNSEATND